MPFTIFIRKGIQIYAVNQSIFGLYATATYYRKLASDSMKSDSMMKSQDMKMDNMKSEEMKAKEMKKKAKTMGKARM